ncbi:hypothetical protein GCM10020256_13830 [Streptomyces thermocoprophilus]
MLRSGVDPDHDFRAGLLPEEELRRRREESPLRHVLPVLRQGLLSVADVAQHIMVVADADGRVLWREGSPTVLRKADGLGFEPGADWREDVVGTNGVGTPAVVRRPVQVFAAEHFVRSHASWTCAGGADHRSAGRADAGRGRCERPAGDDASGDAGVGGLGGAARGGAAAGDACAVPGAAAGDGGAAAGAGGGPGGGGGPGRLDGGGVGNAVHEPGGAAEVAGAGPPVAAVAGGCARWSRWPRGGCCGRWTRRARCCRRGARGSCWMCRSLGGGR